MDIKAELEDILGAGVHPLSLVRMYITLLVDKYGEDAVYSVLDRYWMVINANATGEQFVTMRIKDPDEEAEK